MCAFSELLSCFLRLARRQMVICCHLVLVIAYEIGNSGAEPFAQVMMYYRKLTECREGIAHVFPCFYIIVFGEIIPADLLLEPCICLVSPCISIDVFYPDVLVQVIPSSWHSTNLSKQAMASRTFQALKVAIKKLYHKPIPPRIRRFNSRMSYPPSYTNSRKHSGILV